MQTTLLTAVSFAPAWVAEKGIAIARSKAIAGTPPHNNVVAAVGEGLARPPANGHVFLTTCQGRERNATKSRVSAIRSRGAIETCQRRVTDSDVKLAGCVFPERLVALEPMAVLSEAVVLFLRAAAPIPVRRLPVVFMKPTRKPMARLKVPLLLVSASVPMAMLKWPVVLLGKRRRTNRHVILRR